MKQLPPLSVVVQRIRAVLTPDLLLEGYTNLLVPWGEHQPTSSGHSYLGAEALYYFAGGRKSGLELMSYQIDSHMTHWWLRERETGKVRDPTDDQFLEHSRYGAAFLHNVVYRNGIKARFRSSRPSARAVEVMRRVDVINARKAATLQRDSARDP